MFQNKWAVWYYDNIANSPKNSLENRFGFELDFVKSNLNHLDELKKNAQEIYDLYGKLDILFSGGSSSQIILQIYKELEIPFNVKIFQYENNLNYYWDVAASVKFCKDLNIRYELIPFNLQNFFEVDALEFFKKSLNLDVSKLPILKMFDYCDNTPIIGTGYPIIIRSNYFYDSPADWKLQILETDINLLSYSIKINRPIISNFFIYSKTGFESLLSNSFITNLISDRYHGIFSSYEIRNKIYNLYINNRISQKGFEDEKNEFLYPEYINEFYSRHIKNNAQSKTINLVLSQI
jgi:hypothetical protein